MDFVLALCWLVRVDSRVVWVFLRGRLIGRIEQSMALASGEHPFPPSSAGGSGGALLPTAAFSTADMVVPKGAVVIHEAVLLRDVQVIKISD